MLLPNLWKNTLPGMPGGQWMQEGKERQRVAIIGKTSPTCKMDLLIFMRTHEISDKKDMSFRLVLSVTTVTIKVL